MRVLLLNPPGREVYVRDYFCSKTTKSNYNFHPVDLLALSGTIAREHEVIFIAVPPAAVRTVVQQAKLGPEHRVIIAARGIEPQTGTWLSKIVLEESSALRVGALAGPALADEVLKGNPTAMVIGSAYEELTRLTQHALHSRQCRIYSSKDLIGIELAGKLKQQGAGAILKEIFDEVRPEA